jgi:uncharacterized protein
MEKSLSTDDKTGTVTLQHIVDSFTESIKKSLSLWDDDKRFTIICCCKLIKELCLKYNIGDDHGYVHVLNVLDNILKALECDKVLDWNKKFAIVLATLLHDADDRKLFGKVTGYPNAKKILAEIKVVGDMETLVLEMISYVSASSAGNTVIEPRWKLLPRDSDRIEAIGRIGFQRMYEYMSIKRQPLVLPTTPLPSTIEELEKIAPPERLQQYVNGGGVSVSMIEHFYDKIYHIHRLESQNSYLMEKAKERHNILTEMMMSFIATFRLLDLNLTGPIYGKLPYVEPKFKDYH